MVTGHGESTPVVTPWEGDKHRRIRGCRVDSVSPMRWQNLGQCKVRSAMNSEGKRATDESLSARAGSLFSVYGGPSALKVQWNSARATINPRHARHAKLSRLWFITIDLVVIPERPTIGNQVPTIGIPASETIGDSLMISRPSVVSAQPC